MKKIVFCLMAVAVLLTAACKKGRVTGVKLDRNEVTLQIGESIDLKAIVVPDNADEKTVYWNSNSYAVTVSDGRVTAVGYENARITVSAKNGGYRDYCEVTVLNPITTQPASVTNLLEGNTAILKVEASVKGGATLSYQWYRNSNSGSTAIEGARSADFTIPVTLTAPGSPYYYYCEVRATDGANSVYSNVARVNALLSGTWIQKGSFAGTARSETVGFSIGNGGYIGTGWTGSQRLRDFWEYDPVANVWTQKADFAGTARDRAVGFSIGNKGYVGTGYDSQFLRDFWEYDPALDSWTQKAFFPGENRYRAVGFSIGNKGYIGTGNSATQRLRDFWEYDPVSNSWTQKTDFAGTAREYAVGFPIGNKGYIGTGYSGSQRLNDFWEYDPISNSWIQKANFAGSARENAFGFSSGNKGYVGTGYSGSQRLNDFWEFTP